MKSKLLIFLIVLCILFSLTCVSAGDNQTETVSKVPDYHTFAELNQTISQSGDELDLKYDYKYEGGEINITINKTGKFTINGKNHEFYGIADYNALTFDSSDVVIVKNLTFKNCRNTTITVNSPVIFDNVTFINCAGSDLDEFISSYANVQFNNCIFNNNDCLSNFLYSNATEFIFRNTIFNGGMFETGVIFADRCNLIIENCTFENISSRQAPAFIYKGANLTVKRSKFTNLHSLLSGGAIIGKFFPKKGSGAFNPFLFEDCEFVNLTSTGDGGTLFFDLDSGSGYEVQTLNIINTNFTNCKSKYGGAVCNLGGILNIVNSTIENSSASFEGGAIYTSWCNLNIVNSTIFNSVAQKNGGAIYFDKGKLTIADSNIINSKVMKESEKTGRAIYAYDANLDFLNSTFKNGGISVYADFSNVLRLDVNTHNDTFSLDNRNYMVYVENKGIHIDLINNTIIIVDKLPSKFNSTDWGWTTPQKEQGDNDDCWAFSTVASMEAALLKATGVAYNLSENYFQKLQLKYVHNGDLRISLTGFDFSGLGHALSWYGSLPSDNAYDARGIVADIDFNDPRIHLQDAMIIFAGQNNTEDLIKRAIIKYGAVSVHKILDKSSFPLNTTGENISVMDHSIHFVSLIGWSNDYDEMLNVTGYWIAKDSIRGFCEKIAYNDISFLGIDRFSLVPQNAAIAYIFENNIDYHVNYQTDLTALTGFDGNYTVYSNEFTSKYDELIGAVGTYFNESGINYSFDVYVNGVKVHTQTGISEFAGFRTIVLNKYLPIKTGDSFKVVFKSNAVPYQAYSRQHYLSGMSFISADGSNWRDITLQNKTVCLKVYTLADDTKIINNKNITVDYGGGSYFTVKVITADGRDVGEGAVVNFTINGKTISVVTDANGIAKMLITQKAGTYMITTSYNGKTYYNTITVKSAADKIVLKAKKVTVKRSAKKLILKATLKINGKAAKKRVIKFKFLGKTYKAKTNKKGIAKITIKKNVIKKLKKGKKYAVKVAYLKNTIKTIVKVK